MNWPWSKTEKRESSYTDLLVALAVNRAGGNASAAPTATAALEACSGLVARAFAGAKVTGPQAFTDALTPTVRALIGRSLIRSGEAVFAIDVSEGRIRLWPSSDHDVFGGYDPASWEYRLNLAGPSRFNTRTHVPNSGVVHVKYMVDPSRPWRGVGPLQSAALSGKLSAETVKALGDEASGPRGSLLPVPNKDGDDPTLDGLKADIRTLNGNLALVESMGSGWGADTTQTRPHQDFLAKRLGAAPPAALILQADLASREVLAAAGIPIELITAGQGTASREAYRRLLHSTLAPLGQIVCDELREKLHSDIAFDWSALGAADISGRARAFQSLVGGGMAVQEAVATSGLMIDD